MTSSEQTEQLQQRVIHHLYGEPSAREVEQFEAELKNNAALAAVYEQEQRFNSAFPVGSQPHVDEERLQGNRWLLRQRLQKEVRPRFSLGQWFEDMRQRPLTLVMQGAAMAMTFVLGLWVSSAGLFGNGATDSLPGQVVTVPDLLNAPAGRGGVIPVSTQNGGSALLTPVAYGDLQQDYDIYQLRVNNYDPATGEIDLTYSVTGESRVTGNVSEPHINRLMAAALQDDIGSGARLDTIQALQPARNNNEVYEALIHVLMNDENPGVRYQAVAALADLADQDRVREALRMALSRDMNEGVRVVAFNALMNYRDDQTMALFRDQLQNDSNEYIRTQSQSILEGTIDSDDLIL